MTAPPDHVDHTDHADHTDVGAYALGLLDEDEATLFETHLIGCERCAAELEEFAVFPRLLEPLVGAEDESGPIAVAEPSESLLPRVLASVAAEQSRRRRRNALALAAAIVLVVAGPLVGVAIGHHTAQSTQAGMDSIAGRLLMVGELHSASDPKTGLNATIGLEQREWGTHVALRLSGVHGPLTCALVAVAKDGSRQVVANWNVPPHGYGIPSHDAPLELHGGAAIDRGGIDHFEIRTDEGDLLIAVRV